MNGFQIAHQGSLELSGRYNLNVLCFQEQWGLGNLRTSPNIRLLLSKSYSDRGHLQTLLFLITVIISNKHVL